MSEPEDKKPEAGETPGAPQEPFIHSHLFKGILIGVGVMFILITVFWAGMFIGHAKALYNCRGIQHMGPQQGGMPFGRMGERGPRFEMRTPMLGGHGIAGKVISASDIKLVVAGPDGVDRTIQISKDTRIIKAGKSVEATAIKKGDKVIVLGKPDRNGEVNAKMIKVLTKGQFPPGMTGDGRHKMKMPPW